MAVQICHQLTDFLIALILWDRAENSCSRCDLLFVLIQQLLHHRVIVQVFIDAVTDQLRSQNLKRAFGFVDHHSGMGKTVVVAAGLQVINPILILQHIPVMGVRLKNQIHIAVGKGSVVVVLQGSAGHIHGFRIGGVAVVAVVNGVDDEVRALIPKLFCFCLDQSRQLRTGLEVNISGMLGGNGVVAVTDGTNDADLRSVEFHRQGALAVVHPLIRITAVNIDAQKGKLCQLTVLTQKLNTPVEFMATYGHGGKVHPVHPFGDDSSDGQIGFGSTLPHIAGGQQNPVAALTVQIGRKLIHSRLVIGIHESSVKIVDGIDIKADQIAR